MHLHRLGFESKPNLASDFRFFAHSGPGPAHPPRARPILARPGPAGPGPGPSRVPGFRVQQVHDAIFEAMQCEYTRQGTNTRAGNRYKSSKPILGKATYTRVGNLCSGFSSPAGRKPGTLLGPGPGPAGPGWARMGRARAGWAGPGPEWAGSGPEWAGVRAGLLAGERSRRVRGSDGRNADKRNHETCTDSKTRNTGSLV